MSDLILQALQAYGLKSKGRDEYRCKSPFRDDSDTDSFTYNASKGIGHDMVTDTGYNNRQIAAYLGIDLPDDTQRVPVEDTKRAYKDLADYAITQGVPVDVFERAGWALGSYDNRPCFSFPTPNGTRYRFIDGNQKAAKYKSQTGYKECWFGLDRAINKGQGVIVLCNGEASTIVADYFGVPAFCKTAGERRINDALLEDFVSRGYNGQVWIALDCDDTGRKQAAEIQTQIPGSVILDLGLGNKGDLANYCKINGRDSFSNLRRKIPADRPEKPDMVYAASVAISAIDDIEKADTGYPLVVPFESMHTFGGYAEVLLPGKVCMVMAATGAGKTSWLESWADFWLRRGIGGLWRGDEFSPREYHYRRIQRYGEMSMRKITMHKLALQEDANNIPAHLRTGVKMTPVEIEHYQQVSDKLSEWAGRLAYYEGRRENKTLEPMLDIMTREIQARRKSGEIVGFAVFDYIQLIRPHSQPADKNVPEHALGLIKEWTIDMDIVSLVGSQMTKSATQDIRQNRRAENADGMFVRMDKANLVLAPRILYCDHPDMEQDEQGNVKRVPSGEGLVSILKNSTGGIGDAPVKPDFEHLRWVNGRRERYSFAED